MSVQPSRSRRADRRRLTAHALLAWRTASEVLEHPIFAEDASEVEAALTRRAEQLAMCASMEELMARYYASRSRPRIAPDEEGAGLALLVERAAYWRRCCELVDTAATGPLTDRP